MKNVDENVCKVVGENYNKEGIADAYKDDRTDVDSYLFFYNLLYN